jgi:hypothetical protein
MPTIAQAVQATQALKASGQLSPLASPVVPTAAPPPPVTTASAMPSRGTYPPGIVLDSDFANAVNIGVPCFWRARGLLPPQGSTKKVYKP